jgi:hypothetical protein
VLPVQAKKRAKSWGAAGRESGLISVMFSSSSTVARSTPVPYRLARSHLGVKTCVISNLDFHDGKS